AGRSEVGDQLLVGVEHLRPDRKPQLDFGAGCPVLAAPPPGLSATALERPLRAQPGEIAQIGISEQDDVAAAAAVTAAGPGLRDGLLAAQAQAAVAAAAGSNVDPCPVVEHQSTRIARTARRTLRPLDDRDRSALAARAELDLPVLRGEDRVVAADAGPGA